MPLSICTTSSSPVEVACNTAAGDVLSLGVQGRPDSALISPLEMRLVMLKVATALQHPNLPLPVPTGEAPERDIRERAFVFNQRLCALPLDAIAFEGVTGT